MRLWFVSFLAHIIILSLFFYGLTPHILSLEKIEHVTLQSSNLPTQQPPQALVISQKELDTELAYITDKEQAYEEKKRLERQALDRQILDLQSEQQKAQQHLVGLNEHQQSLKQELGVLEKDIDGHQEAYQKAQKKLKETEQEIARLQRVQEITAEVYQEKLKNDLALLQNYRKRISYHLARYWNLPTASSAELQCQLRVKIIPNGEVVDVELLQSSGEQLFDQQAIQAVYRSSPLPALDILAPQERPREIYMTFIPEDITAVEAFY